jgi:hypothetical protein
MNGQLDLIERPAIRRTTAIERARKRRDACMQRVEDATENREPGWCEKAVQRLREFAKNQTAIFIIEHARAVLRKELPEPSDERAWGVVTVMARKRGYIEPVKGQFFPAESSNASPKQVYRRGPKA